MDPIADLLIFNPLGFFLFSFDSVKEFFSQDVRMYDWSLQPVFNPFNNYIENAGLQFVFKYNLSEKYELFFYYGIYGIGGLSYSFPSGQNISLGVGTVVNRLNENIIHNSRVITPTTDGALGLFYDKNNSLLASLILSGPRLYNARINIYPGLINFRDFTPGIYLGAGQWDGLVAGMTFTYSPVGLLGELKTDWQK